MSAEELLLLCSGEPSRSALRAMSSLNTDHAELPSEKIGVPLDEISALFSYSLREGLANAQDFLVKAFRPQASLFVREVSRMCRPRFMGPSELKRLRTLKSRGSVTSKSLRRNLVTEWFSAPCDFLKYSSGSSFSEERERARAVSNLLSEIGCNSLAAKTSEAESYLGGFYMEYPRLSIPFACIILAKMHGYSASGFPPELFKGFDPFVASAVPISDIRDVPPLVAEALSKADSGSPIFDHHIVLFPSCGDFEADKIAIRGGSVRPVVLGERDGCCYFICEWN